MSATRAPPQLLYVDDDPMFLDLSKDFLEAADEPFEVETVERPDAVLPLLADGAYDAVVSDHDMPGQTGIELLKEVRETYPDLPFVLFTGKGSETVAAAAIAAGVSDYVQKGSADQLRLLANRLGNLVDQHRAETELKQYAEQQRIVAELGQLALKDDLETLFSTAVRKVADGIDVEYVKLLARRDDGEFLLREGVGWDEGLVGRATVGTGSDSQAGYTLTTDAPVVVTDLATDDRFRGPPLLTDHGVVSGLSVVVGNSGRPWGVLGAHTAAERRFTDDDVTFLESVAGVLGAAIDRHEYRETITRQRERLSLLIEESPIGVLQFDDTLEIVAVNPKGEEIFGYTEAELRGETWEVLVTESSYADVERVVAALRANDGGHHIINENVRKDGERIVCEWHNRIVTDDDGDTVAVLSLFQDVTERERQRRELEVQADLFEKAQDIANVGAWEWDVRADEAFWTPQTARIHGFEPDEESSVEKSFERFHPEDRPTIEAAFHRAIEAGEAYDLELRLVRTDGEQRWVRTRGEPQYEGEELVRVRGTIQDVTERKERELELAETVDALRRIYEITMDTEASFEAKIERILDLGREVTALPYGFLTRIEVDVDGETGGTQRIVHAVGGHDDLQSGASCPLNEAYCRKTIEQESLLAIHDAVEAGWAGDPAYEASELGSYIGSKVFVGDDLYGTFCFAATESRDEPFPETAKEVVKLMGAWAGRELERSQAEPQQTQ